MASRSRNDDNVVDHVVQTMGRSVKLETIVRRYTFTDLVALGAVMTGFIDPVGFPTDVRVVDVTSRIPVAFVGTGVATLLGDVGDAGNTDELVDALDLEVADLVGVHQPGDATYTPLTHEPTYAPRVTFTSTGADLDQMTAGVVEYTWAYHGAAPTPLRGSGDATKLAN